MAGRLAGAFRYPSPSGSLALTSNPSPHRTSDNSPRVD